MKNSYSVDKNNCLVIRRKNKRYLAQGKFAVSGQNRLSYWLNAPLFWRRKLSLPKRIDFIGNWRLNSNYDLEFVLRKTKEQYADERLTLRGEILDVYQDALAFEVISKDNRGQTHIQILKINGTWQSDTLNRISFLVERKERSDVLYFKGIWEINKNQQIIYAYEKTYLKRKTKSKKIISFQGFWQINEKNKLVYLLEHSQKSIFIFRVQLESPCIYSKEGSLRYRIGIGKSIKVINLYGVFNFSRKWGITFEMDYGATTREIRFCANIYLNKENTLTVALLDKDKKPLGIKVIFEHKFLKDARYFLSLKRMIEESKIETGICIPF